MSIPTDGTRLAVASDPDTGQQTTTTGRHGDGIPWSLDNIEEKNPFSEFSEEHLSKLEEVLSKPEARDLLQQSVPGFHLGTMDPSVTGGHEPLPSTSGQVAPLYESEEIMISAVMSDHGYAIHPSRAPKPKPQVVVAVKPRPVIVDATSRDIADVHPVLGLPSVPSILPKSAAEVPHSDESDDDEEETRTRSGLDSSAPDSPASVSPRKSGRNPVAKRHYLQEEWVTGVRGRGRGRGSPRSQSPTLLGSMSCRQSSRISDQKQRDLAEKIMLANRQAMEAERAGDNNDNASKTAKVIVITATPATDTDDEQESKSPVKGRGRGRGNGHPASVGKNGAQSSQDDEGNTSDVEEPLGRGRGRGRVINVGKKATESSQDDEGNTSDVEEPLSRGLGRGCVVNLGKKATESNQDDEGNTSDVEEPLSRGLGRGCVVNLGKKATESSQDDEGNTSDVEEPLSRGRCRGRVVNVGKKATQSSQDDDTSSSEMVGNKGRGRGKGGVASVGKKGNVSSQDDEEITKKSNVKKEKSVNEQIYTDSEDEDVDVKTDTKKNVKIKSKVKENAKTKKGTKVLDLLDNDSSDESESSEEETKMKKGKPSKIGAKGKKKVKGKKVKDKTDDNEISSDESDSESSESEGKKTVKMDKKPKKTGKLKARLQGKKGKKELKKKESKQSKYTVDSDYDPDGKKNDTKKASKVLSKKDRLKQLKEAKKLKKAKLLLQKKAKLKEKKRKKEAAKAKLVVKVVGKAKLGTKEANKTKIATNDASVKKKKGKLLKGKGTTDSEATDTSPKKKKLKASESLKKNKVTMSPKTKVEDKNKKSIQLSPKKKGKLVEIKTEQKQINKMGLSPSKAGKRKDLSDVDSPAKKVKLNKTEDRAKKRELSDSEDDIPLKKIKKDIQESEKHAKESVDKHAKESVDKDKNKAELVVHVDGDMNHKMVEDNITKHVDTKSHSAQSSEKVLGPSLEAKTAVGGISSVTNSVSKSGIEISDNTKTGKISERNIKKILMKTKAVSEIPVIENDKGAKEMDRKHNRRDSVSSERSGSSKSDSKHFHKRHDSKESGSRDDKHSHRHQHHRRHSHERHDSVSEDRKDSHSRDRHSSRDSRGSRDRKDSHRHERRESHDKRDSSHSKDRKGSVTRDKDKDKSERKESVSSDTKTPVKDSGKIVKKIERKGSLGGQKGDGKGGKTPAKIDRRKSRKSDDAEMDSSMIDLFKPDNLPIAKESQKVTTETVKLTDLNRKDSDSSISFEIDKVVPSESVVDVTSSASDDKKIDTYTTINVEVKTEVKVDVNSEEQSSIKMKSEQEMKKEKDQVKDKEKQSKSEKDKKAITDLYTPQRVSPPKKEKTKSTDEIDDKTKIDLKKEKDNSKYSEKPKVRGKSVSFEQSESDNKPVKTEKKKIDIKSFYSVKPLLQTGDRAAKKAEEEATEMEEEPQKDKRQSRNKALAFADILKKEKLNSDDDQDDGDDDDEDFEDDENDETWEEPGKLYCICQQPHNQRFMICCDSCEEWFHGKCVGISERRGKIMEKNNEEYICTSCSEKEGLIQEKTVASTTESPDHATKKPEEQGTAMSKELPEKEPEAKVRVSLFESLSSTSIEHRSTEPSESPKPDSTIDKDVVPPVVAPTEDSADLATPTPASDPTQTAEEVLAPVTQETATPSNDVQVIQVTPFKAKTISVQEQTTPVKLPDIVVSKSSETTPTKTDPVTQAPAKQTGTPEKKKASPLGRIRKRSGDLSEKRKRVIKMFKQESSKEKEKASKSPQVKCASCGSKPARPGSAYCSNDCIGKVSKDATVKSILKHTPEKTKGHGKHVAVFERSTGRTLTGELAPTESELQKWLAENPTFEILKAHRRPSSKPVTPSSSKERHHSSDKTKKREPSVKEEKLPEGPEPIRLNVRKGLRDALAARADAADDIMLSNSEVKGLAMSVEGELFNCFKDTDSKYKAKYRSLVFNIKDQKNKALFRKILTRRIRPYRLVRMSPEELASQELSKWREYETKHTIEMIKQLETDLQKEPVKITKKTHKGEVEVEGEGGADLSSLVEEPKKPSVTEGNADESSEQVPDTTEQHGKHLFDSNCKVCTGQEAPAPADDDVTPTKPGAVHETPKPPPEKDPSELTKTERDLQAQEVVKEVIKAIRKAKEDAQRDEMESRTQATAVTVRSPDSALQSGLEKKVKFTPQGPMLWKGFVSMQDVSKFVTTAYRITGPAEKLELPDTVSVCGRINPEHVWDYVSKIKQSATRDVCVVRFIPGTNDEKAAYINLYSYLNSRGRCGVADTEGAKNIKDFYIVPLASHSKIPSVLRPFDGPGLEENRCHMLLGVIIRNKFTARSSGHSIKEKGKGHVKDSAKLKSVLKDPPTSTVKAVKVVIASEKSSSSTSTPITSSSSSTPQDRKKAKSISFDPIVKEYSHVTEQVEEAYSPAQDDLDAPYDPEKEAEKTKPLEEKPKGSDAVSKMLERIAQSKNPTEATATMIAALATTSRLGNQRKLLMELTKKVDEQKRMLEQKRISSKLTGSSPPFDPMSNKSVASVKSASSTVSQTAVSPSSSQPGKHLVSKDPRLKSATDVVSHREHSPSPGPSSGSQLLQEKVPVPVVVAKSSAESMTSSVVSSDTIRSQADFPALTEDEESAIVKKPFVMSLKPKTSLTLQKSLLPVDEDKTKLTLHKPGLSKLSGTTETDSVGKPKGFYVDHAENTVKTGGDSQLPAPKSTSLLDKLKESLQNLSATAKADHDAMQTSVKDTTEGSEQVRTSTVFEGGNNAVQGDTELSGKATGKTAEAQSVLADLRAEVGIKPVVQETKPSPYQILSQLHKTIWGAPLQGVSTDKPTDVANEQTAGNTEGSKPASSTTDSQGLPTALMSLFSGLPGTTETVAEPQAMKTTTAIPSEQPVNKEASVLEDEDVDLRIMGQPAGIPGLGLSDSKKQPQEQTDAVEKTENEKLSKSFLGFDYDSDSSDGEFEGFDDDGTKKLSPRKRKLISKQSPGRGTPTRDECPDISSLMEFGDVDHRIQAWPDNLNQGPGEDTDLRQGADTDLRMAANTDGGEQGSTGSPVLDIDERLPGPAPPGLPFPPPPHLLDVDHRRPPFPPPPGMRLPFMHNQPPPPGTEWQPGQPAPPPLPLKRDDVAPPPLPPKQEVEAPPPDPPLPPLPSSPPEPQPEPPKEKKRKEPKDQDGKKDEADGDNGNEPDKKNEKGGKGKKKKKGSLTSDERLKQIVLEIAKHEPIEPPPFPPLGPQLQPPMPFMRGLPPMGPRLPPHTRPPIIGNTPPRPNPRMMSHRGHGARPPRPPRPMGPKPVSSASSLLGPGPTSQVQPSVWAPRQPSPAAINTQASLSPGQLPPHLQPGVASGPAPIGPKAPPQLGPGLSPKGPMLSGPGLTPTLSPSLSGHDSGSQSPMLSENSQPDKPYPPPLLPGVTGDSFGPGRGRGGGRGRGRGFGRPHARDNRDFDNRDENNHSPGMPPDSVPHFNRGRGRGHDHERDRNPGPVRDELDDVILGFPEDVNRDREQNHDRDRGYERDHRERGRRSKDYDHHDRDRDRHRRDRSRDRHRDYDRDRDRHRSSDRDRDHHRHSRDRDRRH